MENVAAHKKRLILIVIGSVAFLGVVVAVAVITTQENNVPEPEPVTAEQRAARALDKMPVIDGHNDFPWSLRSLVFNDLSKVNFNSDLRLDPLWANFPESATDIPRLLTGRVGAQFWVAYTACRSQYKDSVEQTIEQVDVIRRLADAYPNHLMFATSAADIETAIREKRIASLVAIEGGHSIQSSFGILRTLYNMGARYMTLTHSCNTPWADASPVDGGTINATSDGLSAFGLEIIDEMNRIGMMVDLSHVSVATMKAALNRSKAPVIFSHSSAKAVCNHHRNVPDDVLQLVKEKNGIVMVNFYSRFVQCDSSKNATLDDVIAHIEHIKNITGIDHVGIGADYDGVDETPEGLEDVSKYPQLFLKLAETWSVDDLMKLSGGNLLRVFKEVEKTRDLLRDGTPKQDSITRAEIIAAGGSTDCLTAKLIDDPASGSEETTRRRRNAPEQF